jgi:HD-like signal output (HDOD) protein
MREGVAAGRQRADYGRGQYQLDAAELAFSPAALVAHLRSTLTSPGYKPPLLPAIAVELLTLTRRSDVSLGEVRLLLERDPLLAAKVLQLAQSAMYSHGAPLHSLDAAISRLGLRTLGDLFLQTVLQTRVFRAPGYEQPMAALMRHSTLTGHIARLACRMTALSDDYAFMCGLLHDVGMAAGLLILAERPARGATGSAAPSFEEVAVALQVVHEEASAVLADAWRLNPDVRLVLGSHHHFRIGGRVHPLAAAVCVADWVAQKAGATFAGESDESQAREAAKSLDFTSAALDGLLEQARILLPQL